MHDVGTTSKKQARRQAQRQGTAPSKSERFDAFGLQEKIQRHPFAMVAAAAGVGYLVGGGLFTRLTARLVGVAMMGFRLAGVPYIKQQLQALADEAGAEAGAKDAGAKEKGTDSPEDDTRAPSPS